MDCIVYGVAKSWTRPSDFHFMALRWLRGMEGRRQKWLEGQTEEGSSCVAAWLAQARGADMGPSREPLTLGMRGNELGGDHTLELPRP